MKSQILYFDWLKKNKYLSLIVSLYPFHSFSGFLSESDLLKNKVYLSLSTPLLFGIEIYVRSIRK